MLAQEQSHWRLLAFGWSKRSHDTVDLNLATNRMNERRDGRTIDLILAYIMSNMEKVRDRP
jgi:hypothetical protein